MHSLKKILSYVQHYLQHIPFTTLRLCVVRWLKKYQQFLGIALAGGILFMLLLGRLSLVSLEGEALGTHYKIQYFDRWGRNYQQAVKSLLGQIEQALSTVLPDSELSRFNEHDCSEFYFKSPFFYSVFAKSKEMYRNTAGAFDPTILPWITTREGPPTEIAELEEEELDRLHEYVSLDHIVANAQRIKRLKEGVKLDFDGILRGYAVDRVAALLCSQGIDRAWIGLGSELIVKGRASKRKYWSTPIHPYMPVWVEEGRQIKVEVIDKAVAISSKQASDQPKRAIVPSSGATTPVRLLAAAVVAPDCMSADAYATAMMVRGLAYAQELVEKEKELAAFLIYEDERGVKAFYASPGLVVQQKGELISLQLAEGEG